MYLHPYVRMSEPTPSSSTQLMLGRHARAFNKRHEAGVICFKAPLVATDDDTGATPHGTRVHRTQPCPTRSVRSSASVDSGQLPRAGRSRVTNRPGRRRRDAGIFAPGDIEAGRREYVALIDAWCKRVHARERREEVAFRRLASARRPGGRSQALAPGPQHTNIRAIGRVSVLFRLLHPRRARNA